MQLKIENNNKTELELEAIKNDVEKENQRVKEICGSAKTTAGKVNI
jgi:hypothetical protein